MRFRLLIITLLAVQLVSFARSIQVIRGQVIGRNSGNVYLYQSGFFNNGHQLVDSVKMTSQFFSFAKALAEPGVYFLNMDGAVGQYYFVWDKDVVITLKPDNLNKSVIEDSPLNEQLKSFADTVETIFRQKKNANREAFTTATETKDETEIDQLGREYMLLFMQEWYAIDKYIRANNSSWAGLLILITYHRSLGKKASFELLSVLSPDIQTSTLANQLKKTLNDSSYFIAP